MVHFYNVCVAFGSRYIPINVRSHICRGFLIVCLCFSNSFSSLVSPFNGMLVEGSREFLLRLPFASQHAVTYSPVFFVLLPPIQV